MSGHIVAIYEGTPGLRVSSPHVRLWGSTAEQLVETATREAAAGASRVELCGGVSVAAAAEVRAALPGNVPVGLVRYGYESLELVAAYKQTFVHGETPTGREVFLYLDPAHPTGTPFDHEDAAFVPVADSGAVAAAVRALREERTQSLIELYAGLGLDAAAAAWEAAEGRTPVGFIDGLP